MKKILGIALAVVMVMALFTGCSIYSSDKTAKEGKIKGNVLLSINPEIKISYDNDLNVVKLSGENDDGKQIVKSMDNFVGRPVVEIAGELIGKIDDAGIFEKLAAGNTDGIKIKIDDDGKNVELIALMAEEIGKVAVERNIGVVKIELDDDGDSLYDDDGDSDYDDEDDGDSLYDDSDGDSLYDDEDDGDSLYDDDGDSLYDNDGDSDYDDGNSSYNDSDYDDGNSSYDDGDSDYDD
ncbi:MAG: hypothetical protein GX222_01555 [Ruminococcaceae bacterium]|nr:hypothetical protein [Oscillospiraceae bacterium]